jgi:hypothetical protein
MGQYCFSLGDLWLRCWADGGSAHAVEFDAYPKGAQKLDSFELKIIAWAMKIWTPNSFRV